MQTLRDEFSFIKSITPTNRFQQQLTIGIGDDAAVYKTSADTEQVVCVDAMVEGIHFRKDTLSPFQIGRKALAINISDLAAMGANPMYYLVTIAIPKTWTDHELQDIYAGMNELAERYKMDLIGGDTVSSKDQLVLSVTAIGIVQEGKALKRSSAKPGDVLFVTGPIGKSAAGLELLQQKEKDKPLTDMEHSCIRAHQEPEPQISSGTYLANLGKRIALNDVSDGLSSEAMELAEASNVQIVMNEEKLNSILPDLQNVDYHQKLKWALNGGEDFQLIGTTSNETFAHLQESSPTTLFDIGFVRAGNASVIMKSANEETVLDKGGYNHFS
ncbi:thiamine-phosphate kinase [Shouchella miscanthi]|uniref:thiamine-phosphate kinase n=1 Tax=Shouchella miscanthi TaxID=2598861 RepID=UPI001FE7FDEA|nr:thiamine-phosphate kinase [Shouchella miscanthi]